MNNQQGVTDFTNLVKRSSGGSYLVLFVSFFLLLLSSSLKAQPEAIIQPQSPELSIASLEQSYDTQLNNALGNYFDRRRFFVDVNLDAEVVEERYESTSRTTVTRQNRNIMMPGLPFLPDENLRNDQGIEVEPETVVNENTRRFIQLNRVLLNIYADTSFTDMELEFMRFIAGMAAKIDENRGDEINISSFSIPLAPTVSDQPAINIINQPPNQEFSWTGSLQQYIPGLILMLLLALTVWVSRGNNNDSKPATIDPSGMRDVLKNQPPIEVNTVASLADGDVLRRVGDTPDEPDRLEYITTAFFDSPGDVVHILEDFIRQENWDGAVKAAEVVASVDPQLLRTLRSHMDKEYYRMINEMMAELVGLPADRKGEVIREFYDLLHGTGKQSETQKRYGNLTLLRFLDRTSMDELTTLIRSIDQQSAALVLSYLPEDKAAVLLEKVDKDRAAKIVLEMTSIRTLSKLRQKELSVKAYDKAMSLIEKQREQQERIGHILPILETLPVEEQASFIQELKENEPVIGEKIEEDFVTIADLPVINQNILEKALKPITTEMLLEALIGLDNEIVEAILKVRPKREQRLLRLEMEEAEGTEREISSKAKTDLMKAVRNEIREFKEKEHFK